MTTRDLVLEEEKKGNVVVATCEGLMKIKLDDLINQPVEGLLYDLNRDAATILQFVNEPKWVNDYACMQVIRELKRRIQELEDK